MVSLLPVKLILQVGSGAGYAMIFAVLIVAIIWNLGTWMLGLPASSSHTLIGSISTMADNGAGLQWSTARSIAMAWVLTLPAAALLAGALYFLLRRIT